ncbi:hypothetical protein SKAU_G00307730 [Synaphobranchus kaupii]|uniref:Uncharacterized protein n=1 Tax=Synaphobranchus kaupii TaxID=118154 RepID=A0A9Q1EQX5_SYNKA|nr:hypothetical protein SKAU_G00307730 [Synaphobranchus kaupii]
MLHQCCAAMPDRGFPSPVPPHPPVPDPLGNASVFRELKRSGPCSLAPAPHTARSRGYARERGAGKLGAAGECDRAAVSIAERAPRPSVRTHEPNGERAATGAATAHVRVATARPVLRGYHRWVTSSQRLSKRHSTVVVLRDVFTQSPV